MTLRVYRGLPGSGKTTLAREWVAVDPSSRARVNRDDMRAMLHESVHLGPNTEFAVMAVRDAAIRTLLKRGVDVACDDTNLPTRTVRDLRWLAALADAELEVVDLTDVDVDECVKRDAGRSRIVGEAVIRDLWTRYIRGRRHPLPVPDGPAETGYGLPYEPDPSKPPAVMVDIDGTLALRGTRSPYDETRVHEDRPNPPVVAAVTAMHRAGHTPIFCSGRTEACREATIRWLLEHLPGTASVVGANAPRLHMRAVGDVRKDATVKAEIFDRYVRHMWRVVCVFDDRDQVVRMWRSLGLTVFQVAGGAF